MTTRPASLRRHPRLAAYLVAEAISAIGSWALIIALWGVSAYRFDVGPLGATLIGLSWTVPAIVLGPAVGVLIDRHGARRMLVIADVVAAAGSLVITLASSFPTLVALSTLHGVAWATVMPAIQALPPRVVAAEQLARTNTLLRMTNSLAIVAGPAVGGAAIAAWGFSAVFVIDAFSYLVGAAGALVLRPASVDARPPVDRPCVERTEADRRGRAPKSDWAERMRGPCVSEALRGPSGCEDPALAKRCGGRASRRPNPRNLLGVKPWRAGASPPEVSGWDRTWR